VLLSPWAGLSNAGAQSTDTTKNSPDPKKVSSADCDTLWSVSEGLPKEPRDQGVDLRWSLLQQLGKKECLKSKGKRSKARALIDGAERQISDDISSGKAIDSVLSRLVELASAQISAKMYEDVLAAYKKVARRFLTPRTETKARSSVKWFDYLELVIASAFALNKIDEGLAIAEEEFKKGRQTPASLQGRFAVRVGDLLLTKVKVGDALRFYSLSLKLDPTGSRAQRALYWETLNLYSKNDLKGARQNLSKLKKLVTESDIKGKLPVLESVVDTKSAAQSTQSMTNPDFIKVWRDINLISRK
jgi:tetratricopeptide (TPR) repeat protein